MLELGMNKRIFWLLFTLILVAQFAIRIIPPQNYNFYFTTDQGNNAVHVREIVEYGRILTKGPETSMPGVFAGPLWYYFLAPGYLLFNGHPVGGIFMLILLSLGTTALVMWWVSRRVSPLAGLIAGFALQGYWYFYELSRYEFNPFPVGFLTLWQLFLLSGFLSGSPGGGASKQKNYYLAFIPLILAFNCAVAVAVVMFLLQLVVGAWGVKGRILKLKHYITTTFIIPLIFFSPILLQLFKQFSISSLVSAGVVGERGFFASTNFSEITLRFSEIFARSIIPQSLLASVLVVGVLAYWFLRNSQNRFVRSFVFLTVLFWLISFLFFGSNTAWREWHTIYLYLLTFIGLVLMLVSIPKKIGFMLLALVILAQGQLFQERYKQYLTSSDDPGILANQLKVLDWIYTHNEEDGFNVYTYSPHVYDYQNQYLFWWKGREKYGFVPCEYNLFPGFLKDTYVLKPLAYTQPTLGCDNLRFLIIEPGGDRNSYSKWREKIKFERGEKVDETEISGYGVEKWRIRPRT
ncbi:MAG: Uncharacterized protein G01um10145_739 [Microgenomates group bacterium Gr01-1014_5]|nr:MAG: Uncharacterized protein G01um10145_739 [Microgenomates group bacterium Gr01-1014_5]